MKRSLLYMFLLFVSSQVFAQSTIHVAKSDGDFTDPIDALDAIGTVLPAESAANRYVIKVHPGVYNVSGIVKLRPFIDLEGSGIYTTVIQGEVGATFGDPSETLAVILGASKSEIRDLTVRNLWSETSAIGISIVGVRGSRVTDVRTVGRGKSATSGAWKYGMWIEDSRNVKITNVIARGAPEDPAACLGIAIRASTADLFNTRSIAQDCQIAIGLSVDGGSNVTVRSSFLEGTGSINGISLSSTTEKGNTSLVTVENSTLVGGIYGFLASDVEPPFTRFNIVNSEVSGPIVVDSDIHCFHAYSPSLAPLDTGCLP